MKIGNNRVIIGGGCILLAAVISFGVLPGINKSKGATAKVVVTTRDITAGTKMTEDLLAEKEVGAFGLSQTAVKDRSAVLDRFAACDIYAGEPISDFKLSETAADRKLDTIAAEGRRLVTVSVSTIAAGVGNHIKPGDRVAVMCYEDKKVTAFDELRDLEIYSVENADAEQTADAGDKSDKIAATVTLAATEQQAQKLVYAEYAGKLHLILERRGSAQ